MTLIYSDGTVSVTNGDATVTGSGTAWAVSGIAGGSFSCNGLSIPIASVTDDATLVLAYAWPGSTASAQVYAIQRENSVASNIVDVYDKLTQVLRQLALAGIHPSAAGTITDRDALTLGTGDKDFIFLYVEIGFDLEFYRWSGTAWQGPFAVQGKQGAPGLIGDWKGAWVTATAYVVDDAVGQSGSSYICVTAHTSGTFATDLGAGKWELVAQKGAQGDPGTIQSVVAGTNVTVDNTDSANPVVSASGTPVETAVHAATGKTTPDDADEMALVDSAASWVLKKLTWANLKATLKTYTDTLYLSSSLTRRAVLSADRTIYVGFDIGAVTMSIATPAVVTKNGHGLVAGSRCSFSVKPNMKACTISAANPAVVTMTNTFAAGQPVVFSSTSRLPPGIVAGTTYYVISTGLSGSSFQISSTVGGSAISTVAPTVTISNASPGVVTETSHGLSVGDPVTLATTGALPTGLTAGTQYFVKLVPTGSTYQLSATPEGTAINTSSAGSGTHTRVQNGTHYCSETGALPTGVTAGQDYYVIAAGLTTNAFQFSATLGGSAISTSGSQSGTISCKTGSDSNDGLSQTASGAVLTVQGGINKVYSVDGNVYACTIQLADGIYSGNTVLSLPTVGGGAALTVQGNSTFPENVGVTAASGNIFLIQNNASLVVKDFKISGASIAFYATLGGLLSYGNMNFGAVSNTHVYSDLGAAAQHISGYKISGGATSNSHWLLGAMGGQVNVAHTITLLDQPVFGSFAQAQQNGAMQVNANTFVGYAKGARYATNSGGAIQSFSAGATYLPGSSAGTGTGYF